MFVVDVFGHTKFNPDLETEMEPLELETESMALSRILQIAHQRSVVRDT